MVKKTKKGKERLDKFYQLAKDQGYRSRASFKLIQLAKKHDFLSKAQVCIDLCAAPGGWAQVAQKHMPSKSQIIAIDLVPIKAIHGVTCIQSDITTDKCRSLLKKELFSKKADVVLHDGAPNVGANWVKDAYIQNELVLHSMKLACEHLKVGGAFVTKVFRSQDYNSLMWVFGQLFNKVDATKPTASRNVSAEIFVMCLGFKGGKIDPKFYDPKWVFMEILDPVAQDADGQKIVKTTGATINDYLKSANRKHRSGYEEGDDLRITGAAEFLAAENPAELLVTHHRLSLTAKGSEELDQHPSTTDEIRELCADLKVLGKKDLMGLLKWRIKIVREKEKAERAKKKAEKAAGEEGKKPSASGDLSKNIDAAIDELIDEDQTKEKAKSKADADNSDNELAAEEKLEEELADQIERKRKDERRDTKRLLERQKKADMRRKMTLGGSAPTQDQPELFKSSKKNIRALADQDKYLDPSKLESEDESDEDYLGKRVAAADSDSEGGLDRYAKMEVDIAVQRQMIKEGMTDSNRKKGQRAKKKEKESRRQRVMAAWAGELTSFNAAISQTASEQHALRNKESDSDDDDDDDSEDDLRALRTVQDTKESTIDTTALNALVNGPPRTRLMDDDEDEEDEEADGSTGGKASSSTALVPVEDDEEGNLKAEHRVSRWFSQDVFKNVGGGSTAVQKRKSEKMIPIDRDSEDGSDSDGDVAMLEFPDSKLPKLPLTDKEKRKLKRKEQTDRQGKKYKGAEDEEDTKPMEVAPLEPPRPLVPRNKEGDSLKPDNPRELAETMALGSILTESKKARMDLIDAGYNRWAFEGDELLPDWFKEEEDKHNKPELPITKELMAQYRAKLREINARPIRKVTEAKARKQRRLKKRLEKLRSTAMSLSEASDMSGHAKAKQMRAAVNKLAKQDERKVTVVNVKKGGGASTKGGSIPKGAKVKVVDRRMKADIRGQKRAASRNKSKHKAMVKKEMKKKQSKAEGGRRGVKR